MIVLLNANLSESKNVFLRSWFHNGKSPDWGTTWYLKVGPILIQTMVTECTSVFIGFFTNKGKTLGTEWMDRGF